MAEILSELLVSLDVRGGVPGYGGMQDGGSGEASSTTGSNQSNKT